MFVQKQEWNMKKKDGCSRTSQLPSELKVLWWSIKYQSQVRYAHSLQLGVALEARFKDKVKANLPGLDENDARILNMSNF
jgi:hypothetical protein